MNGRLIIIGASGHGKVAADIALKMNQWKTLAFLDDNETISNCMGYPVIGKTNDFSLYVKDSDLFVAIGNNKTRETLFSNIEKVNGNLVTLIHPNAVIGSQVEVGKGSVIMAGVVINPSTTIGQGCVINTSSSIDHDNVIGDFVHISPGAHLAGSIVLGNRTWVGIGATIIHNISINEDVVIGAGAVIIKSIEKSGTYIGAPGRKIL